MHSMRPMQGREQKTQPRMAPHGAPCARTMSATSASPGVSAGRSSMSGLRLIASIAALTSTAPDEGRRRDPPSDCLCVWWRLGGRIVVGWGVGGRSGQRETCGSRRQVCCCKRGGRSRARPKRPASVGDLAGRGPPAWRAAELAPINNARSRARAGADSTTGPPSLTPHTPSTKHVHMHHAIIPLLQSCLRTCSAWKAARSSARGLKSTPTSPATSALASSRPCSRTSATTASETSSSSCR